MSYMNNQLYLFLLSWIVDYQKIIVYSDEFFVISDKYFHVYYELWAMLGLGAIKNSAEY